jgi:hypothetical protein
MALSAKSFNIGLWEPCMLGDARKQRRYRRVVLAAAFAAPRRVFPLSLRPASKKRFTNTPSRHGQMRECECTSKAASKAKYAHTEI